MESRRRRCSAPEFAHLSRITPSPFFSNQLSLRLDGADITKAHTAFVRYSHDGSPGLRPHRRTQPNAYPSSWTRQPAWADQSILGLTSVFRDTLVNDFRFSYFYVNSSQTHARLSGSAPAVLAVGAPAINVPQVGLFHR